MSPGCASSRRLSGSLVAKMMLILIVQFCPTLALLWTTSAWAQGTNAKPPSGQNATLREAGSAKNVIIGAATDRRHLREAAYASTLAAEFRELEPENQMKLGPIHPHLGTDAFAYDFSPADELVRFAQQHNMLVRGHCFVWHEQVAGWVTEGVANRTYDAAALSQILQNHISTVAKHFAGNVWAWDVVNEAFKDDGAMRSTVWYDTPGIGFAGKGTAYIEQALRWAHTADPGTKLFYNDYDSETINAKSDAIYAMAKDSRSRSVPLDGIGLQMHINLSFNEPKTLNSFAANLKRFSDLGMDIHITEFDVALDSDDPTSLAAQGDV